MVHTEALYSFSCVCKISYIFATKDLRKFLVQYANGVQAISSDAQSASRIPVLDLLRPSGHSGSPSST
jgi:hypothetical protein